MSIRHVSTQSRIALLSAATWAFGCGTPTDDGEKVTPPLTDPTMSATAGAPMMSMTAGAPMMSTTAGAPMMSMTGPRPMMSMTAGAPMTSMTAAGPMASMTAEMPAASMTTDGMPSMAPPDPTMDPPAGCGLDAAPATLSDKIVTVATVDLAGAAALTDVHVEFGKTTDYGMTAPAKDGAASVLLLGMEGNTTYHYRVVGSMGGSECASPDFTVKTGNVPNELLLDTTGAASPGFIVTSFYQGAGTGGNAYAFIINETGAPVWYYSGVPQNTRARMSYDGQYMWMIKANVPDQSAKVVRVKMDGTDEQDFTTQFNKANHDLAVLPDERVAFFAYGSGGCDDIKIMDAGGNVTTVANSGTITGRTSCHVNAIHYSPDDDTLVFSELNGSSYNKIKLTGEKVWVLGGANSEFTGDGASWDRQHGFHLIAKDHIVFFNNGGIGGGGSSSLAVELQLDETAKTATRVWTYTPSTAIKNDVMGDTQRLPSGNTLVTFSVKGQMHEVTTDTAATKVFTMSAGNNQYGYAEWRPDLYGAPLR